MDGGWIGGEILLGMDRHDYSLTHNYRSSKISLKLLFQTLRLSHVIPPKGLSCLQISRCRIHQKLSQKISGNWFRNVRGQEERHAKRQRMPGTPAGYP